MNELYPYGWKQYHHKLKPHACQPDDTARVIGIHGHRYLLATHKGTCKAELLSKIITTSSPEELPKVGDWVKYMAIDTASIFISEVLPRYNSIERKTAGKESQRQVMAVNIDKAVIVQSVDQDFNINRLERYLVQAIACNVHPTIVLNKCDLTTDRSFYEKQIATLQRSITPYWCSTTTGEGINLLATEVFLPGTTAVLLGSSGVGKSSLTNALSVNQQRATDTISATTQKGKHTTTTRDLVVLDQGGMVIDTPGMREFGLTDTTADSFSEQFPAIARYEHLCHYSNCTHTTETNCGVLHALESGQLEPAAYESYRKLSREQQRFNLLQHEKKKQGKQFGKMVKAAQSLRKKYKY